MKRLAKAFVLRQNDKGRLVWVYPLYASLRNFRHYPLRRFAKLFAYLGRIFFGRWQPLRLERGWKTSVFYLCVADTGGGKRVLKIPRLDNRHAQALAARLKRQADFEEYSTLLDGLPRHPRLGRHVPRVLGVRRDGGYESAFVEGHNLATLRNLIRDTGELPPGLVAADLQRATGDLLDSIAAGRSEDDAVAGDWALHNLIYDPSDRAVKNVDLEGFFTYGETRAEATTDYVVAELNTLRHLVELAADRSAESEKILTALSALGRAAGSRASYAGGAYSAGYHSIRIGGRYFRGQRDCSARLASVPYDFEGKTVIDLGCNTGGMLHCLSDRIRQGIGVDFDPTCIHAANLIREINASRNLGFHAFDLDGDDLDPLDSLLGERRIDICFLLSVCMWLEQWRRVIDWASRTAPTLLFESNGSELQQRRQIDHVRARYRDVVLVSPDSPDDPGQTKRALFLCSR